MELPFLIPLVQLTFLLLQNPSLNKWLRRVHVTAGRRQLGELVQLLVMQEFVLVSSPVVILPPLLDRVYLQRMLHVL